jgi:YesN/AraC family two-component response regulator
VVCVVIVDDENVILEGIETIKVSLQNPYIPLKDPS